MTMKIALRPYQVDNGAIQVDIASTMGHARKVSLGGPASVCRVQDQPAAQKTVM